jgi:Raf kinase inhibitor-like YbhB/YbcL family protein
MSLSIASPAFENGEPIPELYTCEGKNYSPPLQWSGIPDNTKTLALICDDPDAPQKTFVHWVAFNIPPSITEISEKAGFGGNAVEGINDSRSIGYTPPCPPRGNPHRYFFKLFALDIRIDLPEGTIKEDLLEAMGGHILDSAEIIGTFKR